MTGTIFDLIEEDLPEGQEGYFALAKNAPAPKDNSFLNSVSEYAKTFAKGTAEGLTRFGRMMGPLQDIHGRKTPEILEEQTGQLEELLPTDEGFGQSALRRGLRETPSILGLPGASLETIPRIAGASVLGETAKELGAPEWLQTAAELTAYIGPDVTKKLLASGSNKELIEFGRKMGMSDEALTPLLQSETKQKWLSKLIPRRGATESALKKSKGELSDVYSSIQKSEEALVPISERSSENLLSKIDDILFEMPSDVRSKIRDDLKDLISKPITGESLINFWADINHNLGPSTKQLSLLKDPIQKTLTELSPSLSKDFSLINDLHSKYYKLAGRLKPNLMSDIVSAAEAIGVGGSTLLALTTGYYPTLVGIVAEKAAKKLAQQMILNPHLQQLSKKMVVAINQNKYSLAKKISEDFENEIKKFDPESAKKIRNLTDEELKEFFSHQK